VSTCEGATKDGIRGNSSLERAERVIFVNCLMLEGNENINGGKIGVMGTSPAKFGENGVPTKIKGSVSPKPTRKSPRSASRRMTVENGTEALNALLDDSLASTGDISMSIASTTAGEDRRNTADPDALAAIMATFDAEELNERNESLTHSVAAAVPAVIASEAKKQSSRRSSLRRSPRRTSRGDRRQTADATDMATLLGDLENESALDTTETSLDTTANLGKEMAPANNDRRMTADAGDMMALMSELEKEDAAANNAAGIVAGIEDDKTTDSALVFNGRESIESVNTVDLVKQVGHLLGEEEVTGRVSMLSMEDGDMDTRRLTGLTVGTAEMDAFLAETDDQTGRASFDTVDTADLMREVQAVCNDEPASVPTKPVKDETASPGLLEKIMTSSVAVVTEEAKGGNTNSSRRSSKGSSKKTTPTRTSRRLSGAAPEKLPSPEPEPELSPITDTVPVYKAPVDAASVRGILSSKKAPKSGRKSVVFGSPKACEFKKEEIVTRYTPMRSKEVREFFSMDPAPTMQEERDQEEGETADNSAILDEWDRLSNASYAEGSGSEDGGSPMSVGSIRPSPRRKSSVQRPMDYVNDDEPTTTVQLPATLNDLLEDAEVNKGPEVLAEAADKEDKTCELENDLGSMLKQLSSETESQTSTVTVSPIPVPATVEEPTVQLESCLTDVVDDIGSAKFVESVCAPAAVTTCVDMEDHTAELEPNLGALLDTANAEMTRDEDGMAEDLRDVSARKSTNSDHSFASSQDTAPLSARRASVNSSRGSLGTSILSPSATPASLLNRLQGLNAAARRTTLSHCETPLAATSRMSIGMKRHSMMTSASRIQNTAKKAKNTALRLSLQGDAAIASNLGLDESIVADADLSCAPEPAEESANVIDGDSTAELEPSVIVEADVASEAVSAPAPESEEPEEEDVEEDATSVDLRDLLNLVGFVNMDGIIGTPNLKATIASATAGCSEEATKIISSAVDDLLVDAVEQFPVQEANEAALKDIWREVDPTVHERAEKALASGQEAEYLKSSARLCRGAAAAKWGEWEAHIVENGTKTLEEQLNAIKLERELLASDLKEKEAFLAPYTALSSSGMSADNHLGNLRVQLREARTNLESCRVALLSLGDETSELLETRKNALLTDVVSAIPENVELAMAELDANTDGRVAAAETEVEQLESILGIVGGVTWTRVLSILGSGIETEHVFTDGVALKLCIALRDQNELMAVSLANVELSIEDDVSPATRELVNAFFEEVLCGAAGPLSPDAVASVASLTQVKALLKTLCGFVSNIRQTMIWLQAFSVESWNWNVQRAEGTGTGTMVVINTASNGCSLCLPLRILMTGSISGLSSSSLRDKNGDVILQRDMASIIKLLSARFAKPFSPFPSGPLRREIKKILNAATV